MRDLKMYLAELNLSTALKRKRKLHRKKATCWCNITGHSIGNPTTSIYIDFNQAKVDEANRRVLDFVFRGE